MRISDWSSDVCSSDLPRSLKWNAKDIRSCPFDGPGSLKDEAAFTYYGTFRPIYAQEVQRQALTDLSRVGLAVSPVMGVDAKVTAHLRIAGPKQTFVYERSEEHTSELQSLMRISYAVFGLKKKNQRAST